MTYDPASNEEWRAVPGMEGYYEVSSEGRLRSVTRYVVQKRRGQRDRAQLREGRIRVLRPNADGYCRLELGIDGKKVSVSVHVLVALAFIGPRPDGLLVLHRDGNATNNRATNLRYGTSKDNQDDSREHGSMAVGSRQPHAKLREADVARILANSESETAADLARRYQVSHTLIRRIQQGRSWRHVSGAAA
ncbi:HNH endonuclease [Cupriavidus taiwanensis]|uniref:NUMOD4 motif-containing HNH endonuclease n=1 Tax=Cupriavidus taiwanensis TaxID=164546 RepID=UPI00157227CB|nr:NUMOD4 motif-containing HNH endonuclease [Cupriavidus taiwanensis]NSX14034.1 HNH endonuclease [Cupriavidus taiwanensis]